MSLSLVAEPAALPVTVPEIKAQARIIGTDDDSYLEALISAATAIVEDITRRRLVTQTWDYFLHYWPYCSYIELPYSPLQSVTHVKYKNDAGVLTTMPGSDYEVDSKGHVGSVRLKPTFTSWPTLHQDTLVDRVEIRFVCGYGAPEAVPDPIKQAIKFLVAQWYRDREPVSNLKMEMVPNTLTMLLAPYRIYTFK